MKYLKSENAERKYSDKYRRQSYHIWLNTGVALVCGHSFQYSALNTTVVLIKRVSNGLELESIRPSSKDQYQGTIGELC